MSKQKSFSQKLSELSKEASKFIEKSIKTMPKGKHFVIIPPEDLDNEDEAAEALVEVPFISRVGKYGEYDQYGIISIEHGKDGKILFHTKGTTDGAEPNKVFDFDDMGFGEINEENLFEIADIIKEKSE